jgi:hypothetical protein
MILRDRFTRDSILALDPAAKINELATFGTEGPDRIFFPLG